MTNGYGTGIAIRIGGDYNIGGYCIGDSRDMYVALHRCVREFADGLFMNSLMEWSITYLGLRHKLHLPNPNV